MTEIPSQLPSDDGLIKALEEIKRLKPKKIGDTGFVQGPLVLFERAKLIAREALSRHKAPLSDEMEICDACGGAGEDNQHWICGKCGGAGGYRKAQLSVVGDDVERAELAEMLRNHHIWCTARDGRFARAAELLAAGDDVGRIYSIAVAGREHLQAGNIDDALTAFGQIKALSNALTALQVTEGDKS